MPVMVTLAKELSHYLHRLALRLEIGSTFTGIFIVGYRWRQAADEL